MNVRLIAITPDAEKTMAYIARVSSPNQENPAVERLLGYCLRHGHWSVFEHAFLTLEIETSRAIARQMLRHRSFTFSEFSQRYAEVGDRPVYVKARRQDTKNRQNSIDDLPLIELGRWDDIQGFAWQKAQSYYQEALKAGIAKECARALLPEGLTPSKLYMTGSVRSWINYLQVRLEPSTQLEHREVALMCLLVLEAELPIIFKAAREAGILEPAGDQK